MAYINASHYHLRQDTANKKQAKKKPDKNRAFCHRQKTINVSKIEVSYALYVDPLSYAQLLEHHVLRNLLF